MMTQTKQMQRSYSAQNLPCMISMGRNGPVSEVLWLGPSSVFCKPHVQHKFKTVGHNSVKLHHMYLTEK